MFFFLQQAAGISDEGSANNYINQLSYLQDMNERQTADISFYKSRVQILEQTLAQQAEDLQQLQGSRTPAAKGEEVSNVHLWSLKMQLILLTSTLPFSSQVNQLEQFEELRRKQDLADEQSGLVVFTTAQDGSRFLKGGTKEKLVERLTAYGANFDLQYLQAFLLTYRAFMLPDELFTLISRAWESLETQDTTKALPVRLR